MTVMTAGLVVPSEPAATAKGAAFVRAELVRRLFEGSAQSRYFSVVLWPLIAAIYWRQIEILELAGPFVAHIVVTLLIDVLHSKFTGANPSEQKVVRWAWCFATLSLLAGACWGTAGYLLASKEYELQRMLLGLVLLATITTAVPIMSAYPPTFYAFAGAATAPLLFVLLTSADPFHQLVGIAGGAYVAHLMAYVRDVNRWQYDSIALAYQKADLARRLQVAYDEARQARDLAIEAQRDAESANQAKSTFLATVSHEIRTPMNGVLGMIDVLERTQLSLDQREALRTVHYSASALLKIIDDILDFSKIEAGRLELEQIELSTVELIEGAAESLAPQAAAKGLSLVAYVAADVPDRVIGDPLRLQQILFNLLGNAIKFTDAGSVRLSLENGGDGLLRIKVADTGIGLSDEQRNRLFHPFVQADSSTTRRFGGTGLGLSIVRRLAEAMQGGIEVLSQPGEGSTFLVTVRLGKAPRLPPETTLRGLSLAVALPDGEEACAIARYLADAGAEVRIHPDQTFVGIRVASPGAEVHLSPPYRRESLVRAVARAAGRESDVVTMTPPLAPSLEGRVLVVDDNSVNRKILTRQLELAGATTDWASDGNEALELWQRRRYDLVLADLQMPNMDGFELARRIRASEAAGGRDRTPILAVTASPVEEQQERTRGAAMDGFLTKPIGGAQLRATLDMWLNGAK